MTPPHCPLRSGHLTETVVQRDASEGLCFPACVCGACARERAAGRGEDSGGRAEGEEGKFFFIRTASSTTLIQIIVVFLSILAPVLSSWFIYTVDPFGRAVGGLGI